MRCPECGHNHPKKEGKICGGCRYEFVFRPDEDKGWTDGKFLVLTFCVETEFSFKSSISGIFIGTIQSIFDTLST